MIPNYSYNAPSVSHGGGDDLLGFFFYIYTFEDAVVD